MLEPTSVVLPAIINSDLKQGLTKCLLDIQTKLPEIYRNKHSYFVSEKQLCEIIIPNCIDHAVKGSTNGNQLHYWYHFSKLILRLLEGLHARITNINSVGSLKFDLNELIVPLRAINKSLHEIKHQQHTSPKNKDDDEKIYKQQRELNQEPIFIAKLDNIKNKAAELKLTPKVLYFSYAWPTVERLKEGWTSNFVYMLALNLQSAGLIVELDQIQSCAGVDMFKFMIDGIRRADNILVICDKTMRYKFEEEGDTGVFFEYLEIMRRWYEKLAHKRNQYCAILHSIEYCNNKYNLTTNDKALDFNITMEIFNYLAFLDNSSIPVVILLEPIVNIICKSSTEKSRPILQSVLFLPKRFSIISDLETEFIMLHQVTQEAVKLNLPEEKYKEYVLTLLSLLAPDAKVQFDIQLKDLKEITVCTKHLEFLYQYAKSTFFNKKDNAVLITREDAQLNLIMARTACRLGANYEMLTSDAENYLRYFEEAINYLPTPSTPEEKRQLARAKHGIGWAYMKIGMTQKEYYDKAETLCREALVEQFLDKEEQADILKTLGVISRLLKRPQDAITSIEKAISLKKGISNIPENANLDLYLSLSTAYRDLAEQDKKNGRHSESKKHYGLALTYCNQALYGFGKSNISESYNNIAHAIGNLGGIYLSQGELVLALKFSTAALLLRATLLPHDHLYIGQALLKLGECYWKYRKDYVRSRALIIKSKPILIKKDVEKLQKADDLLQNFSQINKVEYNLRCIKYEKNVLNAKYVFIIEKLKDNAPFHQQITLIPDRTISAQLKIKIMQILLGSLIRKCANLKHRIQFKLHENVIFITIYTQEFKQSNLQECFEENVITINDDNTKHLLLAGANFIDQMELNLLDLTPMFYISAPSCNIYLENSPNVDDNHAYDLLETSKHSVLAQLQAASQNEELRNILSEEIMYALLENSDDVLRSLRLNLVDLEGFKKSVADLEKCREKIITASYPVVSSTDNNDQIYNALKDKSEAGELKRKEKDMKKLRAQLLTKCAEEEVYLFYLNKLQDKKYRPGFRLMLAYAKYTKRYSILVFSQKDFADKELKPSHCVLNARHTKLLFLLKDRDNFFWFLIII